MEIVFLFYDKMTSLDVIGPHEILCRLPNAVVKRVAQKPGSIITDGMGLTLQAEYSFSDVHRADILVIPGAGCCTTLQDCPKLLAWVYALHQTTTWTTSVCTGSLILGAAGILSGLKATSHWAAMDRLPRWGALPTSARVVEDGKVMTAAGVSAGIDMALTLAAKVAGVPFAQSLQLAIEYDPAPPYDVGSFDKATPSLREGLRSRMVAQFERTT